MAKLLRFRTLLVVSALVVLSLALVACGDDDGDEGGTTPEAGGDAVLIKTHITFPPQGPPVGEVLPGSLIGDSDFCPGGRFRDQSATHSITKTFRCPDGRLTIRFSPRGPQHRGPWEIVNGSGLFEEFRGGGRMKVEFESEAESEGRETFTGTLDAQ